jgi:hypothetical protein
MRSLNIRDVEASPRDVKLFFILSCMFLVDLEQNGDKQDKRKRVGCLDEMVTTLSHMGLIPKSSDRESWSAKMPSSSGILVSGPVEEK